MDLEILSSCPSLDRCILEIIAVGRVAGIFSFDWSARFWHFTVIYTFPYASPFALFSFARGSFGPVIWFLPGPSSVGLSPMTLDSSILPFNHVLDLDFSPEWPNTTRLTAALPVLLLARVPTGQRSTVHIHVWSLRQVLEMIITPSGWLMMEFSQADKFPLNP